MKRRIVVSLAMMALAAITASCKDSVGPTAKTEPAVPPDIGILTFKVTNADVSECSPYWFTFQIDGSQPIENGKPVEAGRVFQFGVIPGFGVQAPPQFDVKPAGEHELSYVRWALTATNLYADGHFDGSFQIELGKTTTLPITCPAN